MLSTIDLSKSWQDHMAHIECPICLEPMIRPVKIDCHHVFCFQCVNRVEMCPLDRKPIASRFENPLYSSIMEDIVHGLPVIIAFAQIQYVDMGQSVLSRLLFDQICHLCERCGHSGPLNHLCPFIGCPFDCDAVVERKRLSAHFGFRHEEEYLLKREFGNILKPLNLVKDIKLELRFKIAKWMALQMISTGTITSEMTTFMTNHDLHDYLDRTLTHSTLASIVAVNANVHEIYQNHQSLTRTLWSVSRPDLLKDLRPEQMDISDHITVFVFSKNLVGHGLHSIRNPIYDVAIQNMQTTYASLHPSKIAPRKLVMCPLLGSVEMELQFATGSQVVNGSTIQMMLLELFNDDQILTWEQMQNLLHVGQRTEDIIPHLLGLCHPRQRILIKKPNTKHLQMNDTFQWNNYFKIASETIQLGILTPLRVSIPLRLEMGLNSSVCCVVMCFGKISRASAFCHVSERMKPRFNPEYPKLLLRDFDASVQRLITQEYIEIAPPNDLMYRA